MSKATESVAFLTTHRSWAWLSFTLGEDVEGTVVTVTADYESGDTKAWGTITKRDLLASIVKVDIDSYEGDEDSFHLTAEERQACRVALDMKGT